MSQIFNGKFIVAPSTNVAVNTANLANLNSSSANVLAILGPSTGGIPQVPILINNPAKILSTFRSGDLVEGASIAFNPSSLGGATQVYMVRVNSALASSAKVFDIVNPVIASATVTVAGAIAVGNVFTMTVNGVIFTYTATGTDNITTVGVALSNAVSSSIVTTVTDPILGFNASSNLGVVTLRANYAGVAPNSITLSSSTTGAGTITNSGATLTGGTGNFLFTLNSLDFGLYTSQINYQFAAGSIAGVKVITSLATSNGITGGTVVLDNIARLLFSVRYIGTGSACTITVNDSTLTTTVVGTTSDSLNITLASYSTIQQIIDFLNSTGKYTAVLLSNASGSIASVGQFDPLTNQDIKTGVVSLAANLQAVIDTLNSSSSPFMTATRISNPTAGLPAYNTAPLYLRGGNDGTTTASDWANAINSLQTIQCQVVVPMSTSSAVHAAVASHCVFMSQNYSPRVGVCGGALGEYSPSSPSPTSLVSARATSLNNSRIVLVSPGINFTNTQNGIQNGSSAFTAAFFGGLLAALPAGTPLTHKYFSNVNGLELNYSPTDIQNLLLSGVAPIQYVLNKGYRVVQSLTTYQGPANFAYNEVSVVLEIDAVTSSVQSALDDQIIGQKISPATLAQAVSIAETKLIAAQNAGYIVGDAKHPAYQSISATANGSIISVQFQMSPGIPANYVNITVSTNAYSGTVTSAA